ncbi:MAG: LysR family transcriptional regulator [Collimonas sp.]|uniref:LysR family transcriptional regulator n=1 Tax=Collimonas sp. TaxID=1963772 RepID=UPI003264546C
MYGHGVETYLAIVRTGSLSKAAAQLNIAQTTVSKRIKALEDEMGMLLIERNKGVREMHLTPAGEAFLKLAEQWSLLSREANILKSQGPTLSLVIAAVDSLNVFVLAQLYKALHLKQPSLKIEIRTLHSDEMYTEVENRQVDVAFTLRKRLHSNVNVQQFFSTPMVVLSIAGGGHVDGALVRPQDLDPQQELFIPWSSAFEHWHDQLWDPLAPSRIKLDTGHLLISLLQEPAQWAIVPLWIAGEARRRGEYLVRELTDNPPDYICYKLTHMQPTTFTEQALRIFEPYCAPLG